MTARRKILITETSIMLEQLAGMREKLPTALQEAAPDRQTVSPSVPPIPGQADDHVKLTILPLDQVVRQTIETAIRACAGNIPRAATLLQISPSTIYRKRAVWTARSGSETP